MRSLLTSAAEVAGMAGLTIAAGLHFGADAGLAVGSVALIVIGIRQA